MSTALKNYDVYRNRVDKVVVFHPDNCYAPGDIVITKEGLKSLLESLE